jgi:hypothetical protein
VRFSTNVVRVARRCKSARPSRMATETSAAAAPNMSNVSSQPKQEEQLEKVGSIYGEMDPVLPGQPFRNVDGERHEDGRYAAFRKEAVACGAVKASNVFDDPVRTFAYGPDASFYRLIPKLVFKVEKESEIERLLPLALKHGTPVSLGSSCYLFMLLLGHFPRSGDFAVWSGCV